MTGRVFGLLLVAALVVLDVLTKAQALNLPVAGVELLPGVALRLSFNAGVSFGLFAAEDVHGYVVLLVTTLVLAVFVAGLGWRAKTTFERVGYWSILGGAVANLIDRATDGFVTDFIDVSFGTWHFPTFNVADIAISLGVALVLLRMRTGG
jgi:signal peptidase II